MTARARRHRVETALAEPPARGSFSDAELDGLPEPVRRHLRGAIAPGTPLATTVHLEMRGHIRIGRWMPFRAREVLAPHRGFLWRGRVGGVIVGDDHYAPGDAGMEWKLAALWRVAHGEGPDVARAAAERAGAEAIWVPTALLPRFGADWTADDETHVRVRIDVDGHPLETRYALDDDGRLRSVAFDRWHQDAEGEPWTTVPCGGEVTAHRTFGGVTVPAAGTFGWHFGTDRWPEGEFFRYEITSLRLGT